MPDDTRISARLPTPIDDRFADLCGTVLALSEAVFALIQTHPDREAAQAYMDEYAQAATGRIMDVLGTSSDSAPGIHRLKAGYERTRLMLTLPGDL